MSDSITVRISGSDFTVENSTEVYGEDEYTPSVAAAWSMVHAIESAEGSLFRTSLILGRVVASVLADGGPPSQLTPSETISGAEIRFCYAATKLVEAYAEFDRKELKCPLDKAGR